MTLRQGNSVERMCRLAEVSRAAYYRDWQRVAPLGEETELRGVVQRLALAHRAYGYRRIGALVRRGYSTITAAYYILGISSSIRTLSEEIPQLIARNTPPLCAPIHASHQDNNQQGHNLLLETGATRDRHIRGMAPV